MGSVFGLGLDTDEKAGLGHGRLRGVSGNDLSLEERYLAARHDARDTSTAVLRYDRLSARLLARRFTRMTHAPGLSAHHSTAAPATTSRRRPDARVRLVRLLGEPTVSAW
ncbi:hypothetical protein Sros01_71690 [Streptomyces roseochromogenus]|nr:hypothetical protein Sros01_71690 [Streptomyces roseochromogenus]